MLKHDIGPQYLYVWEHSGTETQISFANPDLHTTRETTSRDNANPNAAGPYEIRRAQWRSRPSVGRAVGEIRASIPVIVIARRPVRRAPLLRHFQTYHERGIGRKQRSAAGVTHGFEVRESLLTYQERAPQRRFMLPARLPDAQARLLDMLEVGRAHHFCILTSHDTKVGLTQAEKRAGVAPCTPWAAPTARGGGAPPQPTCEKAAGALEATHLPQLGANHHARRQ